MLHRQCAVAASGQSQRRSVRSCAEGLLRMALLAAVRWMLTDGTGRRPARRRGTFRRSGGGRVWVHNRRVTAGVLGPVVAAGTSLMPTVVTAGLLAGVSAAVVGAEAALAPKVLVLLQNGETTASVTTLLQAAGDKAAQATWATEPVCYDARSIAGDPPAEAFAKLVKRISNRRLEN